MFSTVYLKAFGCIISFLMVLAISEAQRPYIQFSHITSNNGLSGNTVNGVIRDKKGFIWIATENGLNKYDGHQFRIYKFNARDTSCIASNIVYITFEDRQGRLWVGTEKGLSYYDRSHDCFSKVFLPGVAIRTLYQDKQKRLWVGSDKGLFLYEEARQSFTIPPSLHLEKLRGYNAVLQK